MPADQVALRDGRLVAVGEPSRGEPITAVLERGHLAEVEGEASVQLPAEKAKNFAFQSFGAQFCEAKVDEQLGRVRVTRWVGAFDPGRVLNPNLTDYKMPTTLDVPPIESILVEHPSALGPHGAKGVGEPPNIEPPAAVANAIAVATGLRITSLPITAEKIVLTKMGGPERAPQAPLAARSAPAKPWRPST